MGLRSVISCVMCIISLYYNCIVEFLEFFMSEKVTIVNINHEKKELRERADSQNETLSSYSRKLLFSEDNTKVEKSNTDII